MLQHIAHDEGQVVFGHALLLVTQFGDALRHLFCLFRREFQAEFLQVLGDVRLAAVLTQIVLPATSEALRHEGVLIEPVLLVAVGMHTRHLRKDIVADDGLVRGDGDAAVTLHQTGDVVELILADIGLGVELVLQDHLHTRQRSIAATLTKTVHRHVQTFRTTQGSGERVRHGEVVVVMGVEVEMCIWIALHHLTEVLDTLQGIHNTQRVGQHKPPDADVAEGVHHLIDIERRFLHTVRPVLEVEVHGHLFLTGVLHRLDDVLDMLLGRFLQLLLTMTQRAFRQ